MADFRLEETLARIRNDPRFRADESSFGATEHRVSFQGFKVVLRVLRLESDSSEHAMRIAAAIRRTGGELILLLQRRSWLHKHSNISCCWLNIA